MGNIICCISSLVAGLDDSTVYFNRLKDAFSSESSRSVVIRSHYLSESDYTRNELLYFDVIKALKCNRLRYAVNTLEAILLNDPVDILAINTLFSLYQRLGESSQMVCPFSAASFSSSLQYLEPGRIGAWASLATLQSRATARSLSWK